MSYKRAEYWFNRFIRLRDCNYQGYSKCVSCGNIKHISDMHAGHYIHGLDFVEKNQHAQCSKCNLHEHGKLDLYAEYMVKRYGQDFIDKLRLLKNMGNNPKGEAISITGNHYREKCKKLMEQKGFAL